MNSKQAIKIFSALAQEVRLAIVKRLVVEGKEGLCPCHLLEELDISNGTLSFHLKELENAEIISSKRHGKNIHYSVECKILKDVGEFLIHDCQALKSKSCSTKCKK